MSKAKLYEALPWLTTGQALDWLKELTGTKIKASEMMQLCEADRCCFYLDCYGVEGMRVLDSPSNDSKHEEVKGDGYCKVIRFASISHVRANGNYLYRNYEDCTPLAEVEGPAKVISTDDPLDECGKWWLDLERTMPLFKPSDIKDLAIEMNALATPDITEHCDCYLPDEVDSLRQQLEDERAKREATEAELAKLLTDPKLSHFHAIAIMLELLAEPGRTGMNQSAIITESTKRYPNIRGLSKRNLEDMFSAANKAKEEAE